MYREDAEVQGYLLPKARRAPEDKVRKPEGDKAAQTPETSGQTQPDASGQTQARDDLTEIPGVGEATARALAERGVRTFEALRTARRVARLGFLTPQAIAAIDAWLKASEE
jgi:predicted flap endonuclease-1-like 5' DNA nuclease